MSRVDQNEGRLTSYLRWTLDRTVSRGPVRVIGAIALSLLLLSVLGTLVDMATSNQGSGPDLFWRSLKHFVDVSSLQGDATLGQRITGFSMSMLGLVFSSALIAVVITVFEESLARIRNGRTVVRVSPDLVVLGWSSEFITLLKEFAMGTEEQRVVCLLSAKSRVEMEGLVARESAAFGDRLEVHCRTGDHTDPRDLAIVRFADAPRIAILGEPNAENDTEVVRSAFAAMQAGYEQTRQVLIAEVCDRDIATALEMVTGGNIRTVNTNGTIALVLAQAMRGRGMGQVFTELTSYRGNECYSDIAPDDLLGRSFGEILMTCEHGIPIGIQRGGVTRILPSFNETMQRGDEIVRVAEAATPLTLVPVAGKVTPSFRDPTPPEWSSSHVLVVGWNQIVSESIQHLRGFLGSGTCVNVLVSREQLSSEDLEQLHANKCVDEVYVVDSLSRAIAWLGVEGHLDGYDAISIVPYRGRVIPEESDSYTLLTLASVRQHVADDRTRIACELRESSSAALVDRGDSADLILSDSLTASAIVQMVDRPWIDAVLGDLLDWHGSAVFIHDLSRWPELSGEEVSFDRIRRAVALTGEIALGIRRGSTVIMNPDREFGFPRTSISGVVTIGAGVGWGEVSTHSSIATLVREEMGGNVQDAER